MGDYNIQTCNGCSDKYMRIDEIGLCHGCYLKTFAIDNINYNDRIMSNESGSSFNVPIQHASR